MDEGPQANARVHRFQHLVALDFPSTPTMYVDAGMARWLADRFTSIADEVDNGVPSGASEFGDPETYDIATREDETHLSASCRTILTMMGDGWVIHWSVGDGVRMEKKGAFPHTVSIRDVKILLSRRHIVNVPNKMGVGEGRCVLRQQAWEPE